MVAPALSASCRQLEARLGHQFRDRQLLLQALTHRSFGFPHNERLEFLGDALLNCVVAELLYHRFGRFPEGDLSRLRSGLVNQSALAEIALSFDLGALLRLGEGEFKSGGFRRPSILADALEALFGAVYLDAGFDAVRGVIGNLYAARLDAIQEVVPTKDPKTALQETLQGKRLETPRYTVLAISGEAHQQRFKVACEVPALGLRAEGDGTSRKAAEQDAAARVQAMIDA